MTDLIFDRLLSWGAVLAATILGRLMYHASLVQRGHRTFWSPLLALDLIIAFGMSVITFGLCDYLGLTGAVSAGLGGVAGYLGPHAIDRIFANKFGKD
jgi:LydA holin phage, holin superfamily III